MAGSASSSILLKGGTILQHDANDNVRVLRDTDLLIQGETIAGIGKDLVVDVDVRVLDCRGKVVSPGFVDTHHHVWQTQLKGRHSDDTLLDYTANGLLKRLTGDFVPVSATDLLTTQETGSPSIIPPTMCSGGKLEA